MTVKTNRLIADMAFENGLEPSIAEQLVTWLEREGVLDYGVLNDTYADQIVGG